MISSERHHLLGSRIYRFVTAERVAHWVNACSFFALGASGVVLLLRRRLELSEAGVQRLHLLHLAIGAIYFFGPAVILILGNWRIGLHWLRAAADWTLSDILWLMGPLRRILLPRVKDPIVGRFNAGQRLNMGLQILGKWALAATGLMMHLRAGQLLMYAAHLLFFLILLFLALGHIYMGLINPATRHSLSAMLSGFVDAEWLERHHAGWLAELRGKHSTPTAGAARRPDESPANAEKSPPDSGSENPG